MTFIYILGEKCYVNEQAELYNLAQKENYCLVFESPN